MRPDLQGILREVATASDLDEVLALIVQRIEGALRIDACAVYLTGGASDPLAPVLPAGPDPTLPRPFSASRQSELLSPVVERRELVVLANSAEQPTAARSPEKGAEHYDSFLGMPLIHNHCVLCVLAACKGLGRFDPDEVTFFVTIAAPLAKIIHEFAVAREVASLLQGELQESAYVQGVRAAAGLAVGTAALLVPLATLDSVPDRRIRDVASEEKEFRADVAAVQSELRARGERLAVAVPRENPRALQCVRDVAGKRRARAGDSRTNPGRKLGARRMAGPWPVTLPRELPDGSRDIAVEKGAGGPGRRTSGGHHEPRNDPRHHPNSRARRRFPGLAA